MVLTVNSMQSLQLESQITYYSGVWILIRGEPLESCSNWLSTLSGASKAIAGIGRRTVTVTEEQRDYVLLYIQCKAGKQIRHQSLEKVLTNSMRKCKAVVGSLNGVSPFTDHDIVFGEIEPRAKGPKPKELSVHELYEADEGGLTQRQLVKVVRALREEIQQVNDKQPNDAVDILSDSGDSGAAESGAAESDKCGVAEYMYRLLLLREDKVKEIESSIIVPEGVRDPDLYRHQTTHEQVSAWLQSNVVRGELRDRFMATHEEQIRQQYVETRPGFTWPDTHLSDGYASDKDEQDYVENERRNRCVADFEQIPLPVKDAVNDIVQHIIAEEQKAQEAEKQRQVQRQFDGWDRAFSSKRNAPVDRQEQADKISKR